MFTTTYHPATFGSNGRCIGIVAVLLAGLALTGCSQAPTPAPSQEVLGSVTPYMNIAGLRDGDLSNPYIKGRLVVIDRSGPTDSDFNNPGFSMSTWQVGSFDAVDCGSDFPQRRAPICALLAHSPDEVGTVVWLDGAEAAVGSYDNGGTAYETSLTVTVIDKAAGLIVERKVYPPAEPPPTITCISGQVVCNGHGHIDWLGDLASLPRK